MDPKPLPTKGKPTMRYSVEKNSSVHMGGHEKKIGHMITAKIAGRSGAFYFDPTGESGNWSMEAHEAFIYRDHDEAEKDLHNIIEVGTIHPDEDTVQSAGMAHFFHYVASHGFASFNTSISDFIVELYITPLFIADVSSYVARLRFDAKPWDYSAANKIPWEDLIILQCTLNERRGVSFLQEIAFCLKDEQYVLAKSLADHHSTVILNKSSNGTLVDPFSQNNDYREVAMWFVKYGLLEDPIKDRVN